MNEDSEATASCVSLAVDVEVDSVNVLALLGP